MDVNSPHRRPRWPILAVLVMAAALTWAGTALATVSITGSNPLGTTLKALPAIELTSDAGPGTTIDWAITGPGGFSDAGSGASPATVPAHATLGADGVYTLSASDVGPPLASLGTFTLDATAPTVTATATKADLSPYAAGTWTNQTVTVHFTCSDGGSGLAAPCPLNQVFGAAGTFSASSGTVFDNAGNSASASFGPIQIDTTAPTVTASATAGVSAYTAGTWTNQAVTVHFACSDGGSGLAAPCPLNQVFGAAGTFSASSGLVFDNAGNSASASFGPIQIDTTAPTGGAIVHVPQAFALPGFARTGNVVLRLTSASTDAFPPAAGITYALSTTGVAPANPLAYTTWTPNTNDRTIAISTGQGATTTVSLFARDAVGNVSPAISSKPIVFDTVGPTVATVPGVSFPLPGANLTTNFGTLANVQIRFSELVQDPVPLIRMCVDPCGLPIPANVTFSNASGAILDPFPADPAGALATGTQYEIELPSVRDLAGNTLTGPGSSPWTFITSTDGTPPGPVAGLKLVPGIGQIALSWTRPPDPDLARITVLRGTTPPVSAADAAATRFSLPATATSFTDVALTPGVTYYYAVYAEDAVGNPSVLVRSSAVPKAPLVARPTPPNTISARSMRPKKGKVLATLRPLMRWKATKGAPFYNLQIVDLTTNKKVVSVFTKAPRYRVAKNRLKAGHRYAWRVWAHRSGKGWFSLKRPMTSWFDVSPKAKK